MDNLLPIHNWSCPYQAGTIDHLGCPLWTDHFGPITLDTFTTKLVALLLQITAIFTMLGGLQLPIPGWTHSCLAHFGLLPTYWALSNPRWSIAQPIMEFPKMHRPSWTNLPQKCDKIESNSTSIELPNLGLAQLDLGHYPSQIWTYPTSTRCYPTVGMQPMVNY